MMETVVYSREYLFVKELYDKGELGRIQFLRGSHQQDMDGWPDYWPGLPPMWYATHCVSPCLAILGKHAESVVCHGSGRIREELIGRVRQPVRHRDGHVHDQGFRRRRRGHPQPVRHRPGSTARASTPTAARRASSGSRSRARSRSSTPRARRTSARRARDPPAGQGARLRPPAARADPAVHDQGRLRPDRTSEHLSFTQGGGHGGSHPHLVHAFLERRPGRAPRPARRRDLGQLDHGRPLCPRVGHEGREESRHPDFLRRSQGNRIADPGPRYLRHHGPRRPPGCSPQPPRSGPRLDESGWTRTPPYRVRIALHGPRPDPPRLRRFSSGIIWRCCNDLSSRHPKNRRTALTRWEDRVR